MKLKLKSSMSTMLPLVGGAIAAKFIKNAAGKIVQNEKLRAAVPLAVGILLSGSKGNTMKQLGNGMIASAGADVAASFIPGLNGIDDMDLSGLFGPDPLNGSDYDYGAYGPDPLNGPDENDY